MGQALYDAQLEYFRVNPFYNEDSISPFLLVQRQTVENFHRLEVHFPEPLPDALREQRNANFLSGKNPPLDKKYKVGIDVHTYSVDSLIRANTVEEVEDHYLDQVEVHDGPNITHPFSIFTVNAQSSRQAMHCLRGNGWVVLLHPATFERLYESTKPELLDVWANVFEPSQQRRIGRWNLVANKVDRCQHFWTSDHLPEGEITTVYRDAKAMNEIDGLVVRKADDGYLYPDAGLPGYVLRERVY